jgi:hypothetical protein
MNIYHMHGQTWLYPTEWSMQIKKTKYFVIMVMIVPAYTGTSEAHWNTKKNFVQILILLTQGKWVPWLFGPKIHRPGCHRADLAATIPTALALLIPRRWLRLRSMSHHASCSSLSNSTQPRWANIIGSLGSGFLFIHGEIYHIYNTTRFLSLSLTVLSLSHYYSTV